MLQEMTLGTDDSSSFDLLVSKCASKIKQSIDRQLSYVKFYTSDEMTQEEQDKLELCPLTNSNCEGEFAQLDNAIKRVGGTVAITTLSNRHLVASNKLFSSEKWRSMTPAEQRLKFHWSRSSQQAKQVRTIGKEYMEKVKAAEKVALKVKAEAKQKKLKRSLKLLEAVKVHGGPVTEDELGKLNKLTDKQLISEIAYLRVTIAPDIRQKRKLPTGKFETFKTAELINQIRTAIKPEKVDTVDVDSLVVDALASKLSDPNSNVIDVAEAEAVVQKNVEVKEGMVGVFKNEKSLGEEFLGVAISETKVQPYKCSASGFIPDGSSVFAAGLKVLKIIESSDYFYVSKGSLMYLKLKV